MIIRYSKFSFGVETDFQECGDFTWRVSDCEELVGVKIKFLGRLLQVPIICHPFASIFEHSTSSQKEELIFGIENIIRTITVMGKLSVPPTARTY